MTGLGPPHPPHFRWDLFHDASKTTRSAAMNTDRVTIPGSKLRKYCHGQLCQLSRMSVRDFSCKIAWTRTKLDPQCQTFKMADAGNHADASAFHQPKQRSFQLLNRKESQNIDIKGDIFTCRNDFDNTLGIQHRNLSIAIVLIYCVYLMLTWLLPGLFSTSGHLAAILGWWWHSRSPGEE